jgi:hypothetical protein
MADTSPHARLQRALERGSLVQAEAAAREMPKLPLTDSLRLVMLMMSERDARYERAAVRWWGQVLIEQPELGLELASEGADALRELDGASPNVARSRLAMVLRNAGLVPAAEQIERTESYGGTASSSD